MANTHVTRHPCTLSRIRAAETGGAIHTALLHTFQYELAKGYLQLTPRVLTNEAMTMELPSQVMNR